MRHFYRQVQFGDSHLCFFAECPICHMRHNGKKLPLFLRGKGMLKRLKVGSGGIWQHAYNRRRAIAVQRLALNFNRCESCGRWVCDDCFGTHLGCGVCSSCMIGSQPDTGSANA